MRVRPGHMLRRVFDRLTQSWAILGAVTVSGLIVLLGIVLAFGSTESIKHLGLSFLTSLDWDPVNGSFGMLPVLWGTVWSSFLALLIAVPISLGTAIFLVRLAPRWLAGPAAFLVELLAAIPSIAYGFWGAAVLVPLMQSHVQPFLRTVFGHIPGLSMLVSGPAYGFGMLTSSIVLAIMVTPIITAVVREVLRTSPRELDEGAYALGATWFQSTRLILGYSRIGIFGAIVLGLARAIGETMAVTMVIGNRDQLSCSLFAPSQTMASLLANEFAEADTSLYTSALIEIALVLLVTTLITNAIARWLIMRTSRMPTKVREPAPLPTPPDMLVTATALGAAPSMAMAAAAAATSGATLREDRLPRPIPGGLGLSPMRRGMDILARIASSASARLCFLALALIFGYVVYQGFAGLSWDFFTKLPGPVDQPSGLFNCIVGSLELVCMASLIGVPIGIACGVYLSEYARNSTRGNIVRLLADVLGGVPSIVVGVVAYALLVMPKWPIGGYSGLAGALALALLMCPIIARTTEEMLQLVPNALREASLGAGATMAQTIVRVVLPAAASGIITGVVLAVARIAGETAPLLFTALGSDALVLDPRKPFPALPLKIFSYATSAEDEWKRQAWAGMLVLIMVILILNVLLRLFTRSKMGHR